VRALPYFLAFLVPWSVWTGWQQGGIWTFQVFAWVYLILPIADALVGLDGRNPVQPESKMANFLFAFVTWATLPVQVILITAGAWHITTQPVTPLEIIGITLSVGASSGILGITVAHELIHRASRLEYAVGAALMCLTSYGHFCIEHVHGHHRRVGKPEDPATARQGEGLYRFLPRTLIGGFASAWQLEAARMIRRRKSVFSPRNRFLRLMVLQLILYIAAWSLFGLTGVIYFAVQGAVAVFMLEVINYLEHYGLQRRLISPGRYEAIDQRHSWNSSHRLSNLFLFNLARHTDHHWHAGRRYQALQHIEGAPQLPAGYGTMFLLALVPTLWFRVMDRRLQRLENQAE
jgi:alkane 1-monooxygenase